MTATHSPFENVSRRRRPALQSLFQEYAEIKDIHNNVLPQELSGLFGAIYAREDRIAAQPVAALLGGQPLPPNYDSDWIDAFLETVRLYRKEVHSYADAVAMFENFRRGHTPPKATKGLKETAPLGQQLAQLHQAGLEAATLGRMAAHGQIRRLLQLYYGRYTFDRRNTRPAREAAAIPTPDLLSFNRRKNVCATLTGNHGIIDPALGLAVYLDTLNEEGKNLNTWKFRTRGLYERQILLMPGLEVADQVFDYIAHRYDGDITTALHRCRAGIASSLKKISEVEGDAQSDLADSRRNYTLAALGKPTLCLMNAPRDYTYVGDPLKALITLNQTPDIYSDAEINYDWHPIVAEWQREAAEMAARPKQPPKSVREKKMARLAAAREKLERIQAEYEAAQRALTEPEKAKKEGKARLRRETSQQKRAAEEAANLAQREKERLAEQHAERTRAAKRQSAERKREQVKKAAEREREAQKEQEKMRTAIAEKAGQGRQKTRRYGPDLAPINEWQVAKDQRRMARLKIEGKNRRAAKEVVMADRAWRKKQATRPTTPATPSKPREPS
jgi:hypothetical protein